jgi:hypothetical protein
MRLAFGVLLAGLAGVLVLAGQARPAGDAGPAFGVAEDASKYADDGGVAEYADMKAAGLTEVRWTLLYDPANPSQELPFLDRAVPQATAAGIDVVLSVYPATATAHPAKKFCSWVQSIAAAYPAITKFIVGNEVNATRFWAPQHTARDPLAGPRSYYTTLTTCYDALKAFNPAIDVIGLGLAPRSVDGNSTEPLDFIRALGRIYRSDTARSNPETGRPLMDELALHPYPNPNASPQPPPDKGYENPNFFGVSQLGRVKQAVWDAFNGTAQPTTVSAPALLRAAQDFSTLKFRIDEYAYQVAIPSAYAKLYTGRELSPVVSEANQAAYYAEAITKYLACDPSVSGVLFFHLIDESDLGRFQSGLERADGSHRPAFAAVADAVAQGCTGAIAAWKPLPARG